MSNAVQQKLAARKEQTDTQSNSSAAVYRAFSRGNYWLDGKAERPSVMGEFRAEGSEQRIADLEEYEQRGLLTKE